MKQIVKTNKWLFMMMGLIISVCLCFNLTSMLTPTVHAGPNNGNSSTGSFAAYSMAAADFFNRVCSPGGYNNAYKFQQIENVSKFDSSASCYFGDVGALLGYSAPGGVDSIVGRHSENTVTYNLGSLLSKNVYDRFDDTNGDGSPHGGVTIPNTTLQGTMNPAAYYACYGHVLSICGFDEVTLENNDIGASRPIVGTLMMALYIASLGVGLFFEAILTILIYANPFRLFVDVTLSASAGDILVTSSDATTLSTIGDSVAEGIKTMAQMVQSFYNMLQKMSLLVLMPIFLATSLFNYFVVKGGASGNTQRGVFWDAMRKFFIRMTFLILGVPLMFACYDATLQSLKNTLSIDNSFGTTVVASTFCNFKAWVENNNLNLPKKVADDGSLLDVFALEYDVEKRAATPNTTARLRGLCFQLNHESLGIGGDNKASTKSNIGDIDVALFNTTFSDDDAHGGADMSEASVTKILTMLHSYSVGDKYTASDYEAAWKSHYKTGKTPEMALQILEQSSNTWTEFSPDKAASDSGKNYKENDALEITLSETAVEALAKYRFSYVTWPSSEAEALASGTNNTYSIENPFYCGDTVYGSISSGNIIKFKSKDFSGYGLSPLSMYNYLNSEFTDTGFTVQSATTTHDNSTKIAHYAVTSVGSGLMKIFYIIDAMALMGCLSIVGYGYALALLLSNLKALFQMVPKVFRGMFGSMSGIAASVAMMFALCCNVIFTVLLYALANDLIGALYSIIEAPIATLLNNKFTDIAGVVSPIVGLLSIAVIVSVTKKLLLWRKAVVQASTEACTGLVNKLLQTNVAPPDLNTAADSLGGKLQNAAGIAGGLAMAGMSAGGLAGLSGHSEGGSKLADMTGLSDFKKRAGDMASNVADGFEAGGVAGAMSELGLGGTSSEATDELSYSKSGLTETNADEGKFGTKAGDLDPSAINRSAMRRAYENGQLVPSGKERPEGAKDFADMNGEEIAEAYKNGELVAANSNTRESFDDLADSAIAEGEDARRSGIASKDSATNAQYVYGANASTEKREAMKNAYASGKLVPSDKPLPAGSKSFDEMSGDELADAMDAGYLTTANEADRSSMSTLATQAQNEAYLDRSGAISDGSSTVASRNAMKEGYANGNLVSATGSDVDSNGKAFADMSGEELAQAYQNGELVVSTQGQDVVYDQVAGNAIVKTSGGGMTINDKADAYVDANRESYLDDASERTVLTKRSDVEVQSGSGNVSYAGGSDQYVGNDYIGTNAVVQGGTTKITAADGNEYVVTDANRSIVSTANGSQQYVMDNQGELYAIGSAGTARVKGADGQDYFIDSEGAPLHVTGGKHGNQTVLMDDNGGTFVADSQGRSYAIQSNNSPVVVSDDGQQMILDKKSNAYTVSEAGNSYVPNMGGGGYHAVSAQGENVIIDRQGSVYTVDESNPTQAIDTSTQQAYRFDKAGTAFMVIPGTTQVAKGNTRYEINDSGEAVVYHSGNGGGVVNDNSRYGGGNYGGGGNSTSYAERRETVVTDSRTDFVGGKSTSRINARPSDNGNGFFESESHETSHNRVVRDSRTDYVDGQKFGGHGSGGHYGSGDKFYRTEGHVTEQRTILKDTETVSKMGTNTMKNAGPQSTGNHNGSGYFNPSDNGKFYGGGYQDPNKKA